MSEPHSQIVRIMLRRIADFFRFMSDNKEERLYYVLPIDKKRPYAYQHSSIRDVATICDLMDLVSLFQQRKWELSEAALFERVSGNTIRFYSRLYEENKLTELPDGNIGDLGFFLLALSKCQEVFPYQLPENEDALTRTIVKRMIEGQNPDGSLSIFFNKELKAYEKSAEAFYLPEALIGLIASLNRVSENQRTQIEKTLQKAVTYSCQKENRNRHLAEESALFYFNWQSQLLYHWIKIKPKLSLETDHLQSLLKAIRTSNIPLFVTVEVACYFEGLIHAQMTLKMLNLPQEDWVSKEIDRCLEFLYELQSSTLESFKGGFVHSPNDNEARIDVTGHVFNGLRYLGSNL